MKHAPSRAIVLATLVAAMMHLLLFAAIRPKADVNLTGIPVPPKTVYLLPLSETVSMSGKEVRTIRSPVMFSLPSNMGFSRELTQQDVRTRLTFSQEMETEQFLDVGFVSGEKAGTLDSKGLMLTAAASAGPGLPVEIFQANEKRPAPPRVNLAPELKKRLAGGVVLPPELNKDSSSPWEIHASVRVTESGMVRHVFLDKPLESVQLNQSLLQLLYDLRFKPGPSIEGSIEIYSPEAVSSEEVAP